MKTTHFLASGVVLAIAVAVAVRQQHRIGRLTDELAQAEAASAKFERLRAESPDRAEFDRLQGAEAELKLEVARLRAALAERRQSESQTVAATPPRPGPDAPDPGSGATNGLPSGMSGFMRGALEQQYQGQLARMREKLQLTPAQEEAIRAIHARQIEQAGAVAEKMFGGRLTREEMEARQGAAGNPEEEIRGLLTPEQLDRYQEYKQEEASANARLVANAELLQMQGALSLTQEQQDQVFNALFDHTVDQLTGKGAAILPKGEATGPTEALDSLVEAKVKALSGVLTPEQLAAYREMQRKQMDLIRGMLPAVSPAPGK